MAALGLRKQNRTPADQLETLCVPGSPDRVSGFRLPAAAQSVTGGDGTDVLALCLPENAEGPLHRCGDRDFGGGVS